MKAIAENIYLRGRSIVWRKQYRGKVTLKVIPVRRMKTDEEPTKTIINEAVRWVKYAEQRMLRDELNAVIEPRRVVRVSATVADLMREYERVCIERGDPRPSTVKGNVQAFLRIAGSDEVKLADLDRKTIRRYSDGKIEECGDSPTIRRTIGSTLRQARSILQPKLVQDYRIDMPDLSDFKTYDFGKIPSKETPLPPAPLRMKTYRAAVAMKAERSPVYLVWLMAYHLGMRSGEMTAARWDWIEGHMGESRMALRDRPDQGFQIKGVRAGNVPISPAVLKRLKAYKNVDSVYILPGDTEPARRDLIRVVFASWMTDLGWGSVDTKKRAHELRRLFGSRVWVRYGKEECFSRMRHMSFSTTERSYLNLNLDLGRRELAGI